MRIGIFSPYLDTLGGGERYMMLIAFCLSKDHQVDIFWQDEDIRNKIKTKLDIDLRKVNFVEDIFSSQKNLIKKILVTKNYDVIFYLSDGSLPFLFAKKNIVHFQVPFKNIGGRCFLNRWKLKLINKIICNSQFTKKFIDKEFGVSSEIVYPPVGIDKFKPGKKQNLILSVARFSKALHAKKQEILIKTFSDLVKKGLKNWRLILAGGLRKEDQNYFKWLENQARGFPIELFANVSFKHLQNLYGKAKIFWHAAGFRENEKLHPERMEHFGIVVVEAMAAGCVPVVFNGGGLPEIVDDGQNGFLWKTERELQNLTLQLIKQPKKIKKISFRAVKSSRRFSEEVFCKRINEIIEN